MNQTWHRHIRILAARVEHFIWSRVRFLNPWHYLPTNRAIWIIPVDQAKEMWSNTQSEFLPS
jgi:hypothetical protein